MKATVFWKQKSRAEQSTRHQPTAENQKDQVTTELSLQISLLYSPDNKRSFDKRSRVSLILPEGQHKKLEVVHMLSRAECSYIMGSKGTHVLCIPPMFLHKEICLSIQFTT
jgi:hypothetical protein